MKETKHKSIESTRRLNHKGMIEWLLNNVRGHRSMKCLQDAKGQNYWA